MMRKEGLYVLLLIFFSGCNNDIRVNAHKIPTDSAAKREHTILPLPSGEVNILGSVWIIGQVGVNGEQPDTMKFLSVDTLIYVSTDTGPEHCSYQRNGDTILWTNFQIRLLSVNAIQEVQCKKENKMLYEGATLKYLNSVEICDGRKEPVRIQMDSLDIRFRRIQ